MSSKTTEYMRMYRSDPAKREVEKARQRAVSRALYRLANLYPHKFEELCNEERAVEGLPPLGSTDVGRPPRSAA